MKRDSNYQVRVTPTRTEIIIMATRTQNVLGEKGRRIRELTSVVQKRFNFPEGTVELYAEKVSPRKLLINVFNHRKHLHYRWPLADFAPLLRLSPSVTS